MQVWFQNRRAKLKKTGHYAENKTTKNNNNNSSSNSKSITATSQDDKILSSDRFQEINYENGVNYENHSAPYYHDHPHHHHHQIYYPSVYPPQNMCFYTEFAASAPPTTSTSYAIGPNEQNQPQEQKTTNQLQQNSNQQFSNTFDEFYNNNEDLDSLENVIFNKF